MNWNRFGTVLTQTEYRSIRTWLVYTVISTALLLGYMVYTEFETWFTWQTEHQQLLPQEAASSLAQVLQEKGALKKELEELSKKHGELARIRQQVANPYRILQELQRAHAAGITLLSATSEGKHMHMSIEAPDRHTLQQFIDKYTQTPDMQPLELQSLEVMQQGGVQAKLKADL